MMSHAFASRSGVAGTLLATGWLLFALSLAPMTPAFTQRVDGMVASQEDQDYPSDITLNEFMPDPNSDWNDDGTVSDASDEYIELYNDGSAGDVRPRWMEAGRYCRWRVVGVRLSAQHDPTRRPASGDVQRRHESRLEQQWRRHGAPRPARQ